MWLFSSFTAITGTIALHAIAARLFSTKNRIVLFIFIGFPIGLALGITMGSHFGWFASQTFAALALFAFFCELYLFLFTFALASISANLLVTLRAGAMGQESIEKLYDSRGMVVTRFNRLVSTGLIQLSSLGVEAEGYELTPRGERLLSTLNTLRRIFKHV